MLIDLEVAIRAELECKATVFGQLLEHMVEESDPGRDLERAFPVEVHANVDPGLFRLANHGRMSRRKGLYHAGPRMIGSAQTGDGEATDLKICGQREIRGAIADDGARRQVDRPLAQVGLHETRLGLAAVAALRRPMRTDEHGIKADPLRAERIEHELMGVREPRERESVRAETILIGHDDQSVTPAGELAERGEHTRHEAYLGERVDLGVRGLLN